tara:strand:- start:2235 stop:2861 length:627 start_codon:yes stop_codon:yes gene_type:complete
MDKIITRYKCKKIINEFYSNNINYMSLDDILLKPLTKKCFNEIIYNNIKNNKRKEECLVCYDNKNIKYKLKCCDKQFICLDCLKNFFTNNKLICLYCRKDLQTEMLNELRTHTRNQINQSLSNKIYLKKKKLLNSDNVSEEVKIQRSIAYNKFIDFLLKYNYDIDSIDKIEFVDLYSFEVTWNNGSILYILSTDNKLFNKLDWRINLY